MAQTPKQYTKNKLKREQTLYRIVNGVGFYVTKGVEITRDEFNKLFPLHKDVRSNYNPKGENSDKTRAWMD